ncbi:hypothetical protein [Aquirufa sp. 5-AUSEE-100C1]|jgi:hypothetical protein
METPLNLTEPQMELVRAVFESYSSKVKSIFDVDCYIDQIFETCIFKSEVFDLSNDDESGDLAVCYFNLIYDYLDMVYEEVA